MTTTKPTVVISLLGTTLDAGLGSRRWDRWRPTVSLSRHKDLPVRRLVLLRDPKFLPLAETVARDIQEVSPHTEVQPRDFLVKDPWDFEEVYGALHDFARTYAFDVDREDYLVHITTGTHVAQ